MSEECTWAETGKCLCQVCREALLDDEADRRFEEMREEE